MLLSFIFLFLDKIHYGYSIIEHPWGPHRQGLLPTSILNDYRIHCSIWGQAEHISLLDDNMFCRILSWIPVPETRVLIWTILYETKTTHPWYRTQSNQVQGNHVTSQAQELLSLNTDLHGKCRDTDLLPLEWKSHPFPNTRGMSSFLQYIKKRC